MSDFTRDGFAIFDSVVSPNDCRALLAELVRDLGGEKESYVHEPELRRHMPLFLSATLRRVLCRSARAAERALVDFIGPFAPLAELSAVVVFPGAKAQRGHQDVTQAQKRFATLFVNLTPTHADAGALVIEGQALALPLGSVILMDGRAKHFGGANTSADRVRPVVYASFGDPETRGPVFSIRSEYKNRFRLQHFLPRAFSGDEMIALAQGVELLPRANTYALARDDKIETELQADAPTIAKLSAGPTPAAMLDDKTLQTLWLAGAADVTSR